MIIKDDELKMVPVKDKERLEAAAAHRGRSVDS